MKNRGLNRQAHSIYNQIKRGDIEGVKIGAGTHKRNTDVSPGSQARRRAKIMCGVTVSSRQFSTSADVAEAQCKHQARPVRDGACGLGLPEPDDSEALPYDTYIIEEKCVVIVTKAF